jgi:hypothetical protein
MDELIETFLESFFIEDFIVEVHRSFDLFDFFEYSQAYIGFTDIATDHQNTHNEELKDRFVIELHKKLDYVLQQHEVVLNDQATIYHKNEVLTALAHLQKLEDYTGIIRCLESMMADEEQFATIIADTSKLEMEDVLTILQSVSSISLETLKEYIYKKEQEAEQAEELPLDLLSNFKSFHELNGTNTLGAKMVENGMLVGNRFSTYLSYIESDVVTTDIKQTALNILSCIYLSIDGYNSPLLVYRKYSFRLLQDLVKVGAVETAILSLIAAFSEYKKVQIEKTRLHQNGVTT